MSQERLLQNLKFVHGKAPVADAFSGTVNGAAIRLGKAAKRAVGIVYKGVGTTGTSTITVEACTASDGTGATAIPFRYQVNTGTDVFGNLTECAATGFATTAGSNHIYAIEVDPRDAAAVGADYVWVRIKAVEVVDDPVLGGIMWIPYDFRFNGDSLATVLA